MTQQRWWRIIPVALIMYTISYVDRTNISLALDPNISSMMKDLAMNDELKGKAAGIFFIGYVLLQLPGGYLATHWSARKAISIFLVCWGICAVICGLSTTFHQFEVSRFLLGIAESGVFPATTVLLANWFPRSERARANAYWNLCQPLAVAGSAPFTTGLLGNFGWKWTLIIEGGLPFLWLPIWLYFIRDHPREAKWISTEEREYLETTLRGEISKLEPDRSTSVWRKLCQPVILLMVCIYFLHNCAAYGCMTFFTDTLKGAGFTPREHSVVYGTLFAIPYAVTAVIMVLVSWHSDAKHERRGHAAFIYGFSGICLIASVTLKGHFWISYGLMCLAIPGPFAAMAPFWAIPSEVLPRSVLGLVVGIVNAVGNVGGYFGPKITGQLKEATKSIDLPFSMIGIGMIVAAGLCMLLPKAVQHIQTLTPLTPEPSPATVRPR